jgi:hypothetical protein
MAQVRSPQSIKEYPFIPSFDGIDWQASDEEERRDRARIVAAHTSRYSRRSEYAWEADAWHDVFGRIRNDPFLAM